MEAVAVPKPHITPRMSGQVNGTKDVKTAYRIACILTDKGEENSSSIQQHGASGNDNLCMFSVVNC